MSKDRNYCLTFFKKPEFDTENKLIRYLIVGEEVCPETKRLHWQSYIELNKPTRISQIKKIFNDKTVHCEKRRGTRDEARAYCKKDNNWQEHGSWIQGQGHRSDLTSIVDQMKSGTKLESIMIDNPTLYCKYRNGLKDINASLVKERTKNFRALDVTLITGPTGCGKTRLATEHSQNYYKIEGESLSWFQDYNEEETLVIDEYNNDVSITKLLNILDGYQLRLNVKGSHTYANWTKVFITTNLKLNELHSQAKPAHRDALMRRITNVIDMWPTEL